MPRVDPAGRGDYAAGCAGDGSVVSVNDVAVLGPNAGGDPGSNGPDWLNPFEIVAQRYDADHAPQLVAVQYRSQATRVLLDVAVTQFCAGGGRFAAICLGARVVLGVDDGTTTTLIADGLQLFAPMAFGPDGTLAYRVWDMDGLLLCPPDRAPDPSKDLRLAADNVQTSDVQVFSPTQAIWREGDTIHAIGMTAPTVRLPGQIGWLRSVLHDGRWWMGYQSFSLARVVLHPFDSLLGYAWGAVNAFRLDVADVAGQLRSVWSTVDGDQPGALAAVTATGDPVDLTTLAPPPLVIAPFNHPVLIAPFAAAGSGAPDLFTLGTYTEEVAPTFLPGVRMLVGHDSETRWNLPAGMRPWDVPFLEWYRDERETLAETLARCTANTVALLAAWPGQIGGIPMFYRQTAADGSPLWTEQQVLDWLAYLSGLVNLSPRIVIVAPFAFNRADEGISANPRIMAAFQSLLKATPGMPTFIPIGATPPPAPQPKPKPVPAPTPKPAPVPPVPEGVDLMEFAKFTDPLKQILAIKAVQPHATRPGCSTLIKVDGRVVSIQPDGSLQDRDPNTDGGYETCKVSGSVATFCPDGNAAHIYTEAFVIVDGLL